MKQVQLKMFHAIILKEGKVLTKLHVQEQNNKAHEHTNVHTILHQTCVCTKHFPP